MSMYKLTRQEVAEKLNISTRSVDRYIKSWKLRSKKEWKIVYVNDDDVNNLMWNSDVKQEVIVENKVIDKEPKTKSVAKSGENVAWTLWAIYKDLKEELQKKDELIQTLAMRVGKSEEVAKNSVSLLEFKKSQYLLEESKDSLSKEIENIEKEKIRLEGELKYEKKTNNLLTSFLIILLIAAVVVWFIQV